MNYPIYCEQPLPSGFFEPFNAITNLAFIIAGIIAIIHLRKRKTLDRKAIYLSSILIIIGMGSFLWHFHRTDLNLMLDSIPIGIFVLSFLFFYLIKTTTKLIERILLTAGFFIYTPLLSAVLVRTELVFFENGGAGYFSAITYLIVLQIFNYFKDVRIIRQSLIIVFVFMLSLWFRQIDLIFCEETHHIGTHFIWHILNAITLYLMINIFYQKQSGS